MVTDQDKAGKRKNDGDGESNDETLRKMRKEGEAMKKENEAMKKENEAMKKENEAFRKDLEASSKALEASSIRINYTKKNNEQMLIFQIPRLMPSNRSEPSQSGHNQIVGTIKRIDPDPFGDFAFDASTFPFEYKAEEGNKSKRIERYLKVQAGGTLKYSNEAEIQHYTFLMVMDALICAGLEDLCTPSLEMTLFACRPDIVVVTTKKFPKTIIMCIEVKNPNIVTGSDDHEVTNKSNVFTNTKISHQVYTYLMALKQLGHEDPIVCLTTFEKICMASLSNPNDYTGAQESAYKKCLLEIVTRTSSQFIKKSDIPDEKIVDKPPTSPSTSKCSGESISTCASTESDSTGNVESVLSNLESEVYYGNVIGSDRAFPYLVSTLLLAYGRAISQGDIICDEKVSQLLKKNSSHTFSSRRIFPRVDKLGLRFVKTSNLRVEYPCHKTSANAEDFLLLETLGQGRSGKVFLACTIPRKICVSGKIYVLKLYLREIINEEKNTDVQDREFKLWQKLYGDAYIVKKKSINQFPALLMPYGRAIDKEDRLNEKILRQVKKLLTNFATQGYCYDTSDLRWRHILYDAAGDVMLVDLESMGKQENAAEKVEKDFESLITRA